MGHTVKDCLQRKEGESVGEEEVFPYESFLGCGSRPQFLNGNGKKGQRIEPKQYIKEADRRGRRKAQFGELIPEMGGSKRLPLKECNNARSLEEYGGKEGIDRQEFLGKGRNI